MSTTRDSAGESSEDKSGLVDGAKTIRADNQRDGPEPDDQFPGTEVLTQWTQKPTSTFNQQPWCDSRRPSKESEALSERDMPSLLLRSKAGRQRSPEMPRVDRIQAKSAALSRMDQFRVGTVTGTEGLDRQVVVPPSFQMVGEQDREIGLSNLGVGACYEPGTGRHREC